jgi:ubiquinone biosynthesis protein UbiJ
VELRTQLPALSIGWRSLRIFRSVSGVEDTAASLEHRLEKFENVQVSGVEDTAASLEHRLEKFEMFR